MLQGIYNFFLNRKNLKNLKKLKNIHKGERCFIVGNGPSLTKLDLNKIENEIIIASNNIFYLFEDFKLRPTYYTVEDVLVAEDRAMEINNLKGFLKLIPEDLKYCIGKDDNTLYINFNRKYKDFPKFTNNFADHVYFGGTVSYLNIQLADYLGCNEIYLIGFDHNYEKPDTVIEEGNVWTSQGNDPNHFHPNYFGKGYRWHYPRTDRMEIAYKEAKRFLEKKGKNIYNATLDGKLEIFKRIDFEDLF